MTVPIYPSRFLLVAGLGNPGQQYEATRHNMGFLCLDEWAKKLSFQFVKKSEKAKIAQLDGTTFIKPQTFMNLSGDAVAPWMRFHRIKPECLLVIHDELDIEPGTIRFKFGGGAAGHRGLLDIAKKINSLDFWRIRIGIGRPETPHLSVSDFVLGKASIKTRQDCREKAQILASHWPAIQKGQLHQVIQSIHHKLRTGSAGTATGTF